MPKALTASDAREQIERLHLLSVPGMRESIRGGLETPVEQCEEEPGWHAAVQATGRRRIPYPKM